MRASKKQKRTIREKRWYDPLFGVIMIFVFIVLIVILPILLFLEPFESSGEYEGHVSGLYQRQTRYASPTRFLVTLDNGKIVAVNAAKMGTFQKGKRVIVREWISRWFRRTRYAFIQYIEPSDGIELIP